MYSASCGHGKNIPGFTEYSYEQIFIWRLLLGAFVSDQVFIPVRIEHVSQVGANVLEADGFVHLEDYPTRIENAELARMEVAEL